MNLAFWVSPRRAFIYLALILATVTLTGRTVDAGTTPRLNGQWEGIVYSGTTVIQLHLRISRQRPNGRFRAKLSGLGRTARFTSKVEPDGSIEDSYQTRFNGQPATVTLHLQADPTFIGGTVEINSPSAPFQEGTVELNKVQ
jgi:hypothetical protein